MGVDAPPVTEAEMRQQLDSWYDDGDLRADEKVAETVAFLRNPPFHPSLRLGYRMLFAAAVSSLEPKNRDMLGLRTPRLGPVPVPVRLGTRATLAVVRLALCHLPKSSARTVRSRLHQTAWKQDPPASLR